MLTFDAVMTELQAPYTPEACERETVAAMNRADKPCTCGAPTTYSHAVGGRRCTRGDGLLRASGAVVRRCTFLSRRH